MMEFSLQFGFVMSQKTRLPDSVQRFECRYHIAIQWGNR